jgi:RNA polymerase sigma factor (sigma-70 family)
VIRRAIRNYHGVMLAQSPPPSADEDVDRKLLEAWAAGDRRAGNTLLTRHYVWVRRYFLSKDESFYKDLTNRTFEQCIKSREDFRGDSSFRSYLFGIAYRVLCSHLRELKRREFHPFDPESDALVDTGLPAMSSYIFANEQARMLLACLRRLTLNAQTVLELRYWSELPELEIQRVLNLPTRAAVAGRLRVAKEALRREWARVQPDLALTEDNLDAWMSDIRQLVDRQNPQDL